MYVSHFGCREHPFHITPDPRFFYATDVYEEAYANLRYGIRERKGFIVLTGEVGTGKTTLLRRLMDELQGSVHFVFFYNTSLIFEEILDFICQDFDLPLPPQASRLRKIQALNDFLLAQLTQGSTGVLLIDEAQNLSDEVLENLRLLSNLETAREKLLQIVLVGQPELDRKLAQPQLRQLKQRIVMWSRLGALPDREVGPFIRHRLHTAGCEQLNLFSPEAIQRITFYAKGIPRLINVICDNALLIAYATSQLRVTEDMIEEVAADLGLRERSKLLTWKLLQRAQPRPEELRATYEISTPRASAPPPIPVSVALQETTDATEIPSCVGSPLSDLTEEKSVPVLQNRDNDTLLSISALEASYRSHSRQTRLVAIALFVTLTILSFPNFLFSPQRSDQRSDMPQSNSAPPIQDQPQHRMPPAVSPDTPPTSEVVSSSQTQSPDLGSAPITILDKGSSSPTSTSFPSSLPPSADSQKKTSPTPVPKLVTKEVGFAAAPRQGPPKSTPSSQEPKAQGTEKESKPLRKERIVPQTELEESQPQETKKDEHDQTLNQPFLTESQREAARIELANRGIPTDGPAILASAEHGDTETLSLLHAAGASPNATDLKGWNALMIATMNGQTAAVRTLISNGAEANDKNEAGGTALMMAAIKGHQEILQALISGGAAVNVKNKEGWTPLMYAAWNGHTTVVRTLVDKGADVNAKNQEGWTPLMCAAWNGSTASVQILLNHGASAEAKNKDGETALHLATRHESSEVIQLLKPASAEE